MDFTAACLFAAETSSTWSSVVTLAIVSAALVLPFVIGSVIAKSLRMRDYGWKIGLILSAIALSCVIIGRTWDPVKKQFNFKLGVDLQGGVILIYEVEQSVKFTDDLSAKGRQNTAAAAGEVSDFSMSALIEALSRRINPAGTKEIVIRPYGERQVELIIPEVDQREVDQIKKVISTAGVLQFRIVANSRDHQDIIDLAREAAQDPIKKRGRVVYDASGAPVGLWARVGRESKEVGGLRPFTVAVGSNTVRDAFSGNLLEIPDDVVNNVADRDDDARRVRLTRYVADQGLKEIDVLMETNDNLNVNGSHLGGVMKSVDEFMNPCIHFSLKGVGVGLFGELTGKFSPEGQFSRQLGIVLDNELLSAPNIQERISERGRITGKFTDEEVQFLVNILQAGSLPVVLNKNPISSNLINPLLGKETIEQGKWAMVLALALVFLFMLAYYRFSGFLACVVLLLNILFTLAIVVLIKAPLTLPGLAGLVLTVGMAVDSNVLIYERIREELTRGAALRMALRNGFARATTTIIDSNLTTMLTALILYAIGTDQLRGFAVTLTLGLITSMFTAIFCSRVFFDIVERTRFLTTLKMFQFLGETKIDFIGYRYWAVTGSIIVIVIGVGAAIFRGEDLFDIDFTGGSSVHVMLEKPAESEDVRKLLDSKFQSLNVPYSLTGMSLTPGQTVNSMFKVDAKIAEVEELEKIIHDTFRDNPGDIKLATYSLDFANVRETTVTAPAAAATKAMPTAESAKTETVPTESAPSNQDKTSAPDATKKAPAEPATTDSKQPVEEKKEAAPAEAKAKEKAKEKVEEKKDVTPPKASESDSKKDSSGTAPDKGEAAKAETKKSDAAKTDGVEKTEEVEKKKEASQPQGNDGAETELPPDNVLALAQEVPKSEDKSKSPITTEAKTDTAPKTEVPAKTDSEPKSVPKSEFEAKPAEATLPVAPATSTQVEANLTFGHAINASTLRAEVEQTAQELNIPLSYFDVANPNWDGGSNAFTSWTLRLATTKDNADQMLAKLKEKFADEPVWPSSNKIGPTVAGRLQRMAIMALIASWIGIIAYVWVRFQSLVFGLAAVVALVHDVLVTIAALAVSHWLAGMFGFLLIEDFKISLTIVAALLTIIGYSINDTIVIFDRIREIKGKSPDISAGMINTAVNQTLGRTLLTFFTTFIVVVVLYALGGQGIHGFAFAMVVGMITGTYSTVFIATPFVLWLAGKSFGAKAKA